MGVEDAAMVAEAATVFVSGRLIAGRSDWHAVIPIPSITLAAINTAVFKDLDIRTESTRKLANMEIDLIKVKVSQTSKKSLINIDIFAGKIGEYSLKGESYATKVFISIAVAVSGAVGL